MRRFLMLLAACLAVCTVSAQRRDSVYTASEQFTWKKLVVPVSLLGAGTIASFTPWYHSQVNLPVRDWVLSQDRGKDLGIENYTQVAALAGYALAAVCGAGEHGFWEQALLGFTALGLTCASAESLKSLIDKTRPNGGNRSFPSGHTAVAFMGAELVRLEYGPWWGLSAYCLAGFTAFMRIWNNRHWTSDVVTGAGMGVLMANAAYWLLPLERRLLRLDSKRVTGQHYHFCAVPYAATFPQGNSYGITLSCLW
jgi:membrane-associated phospholipid phosphatase